MLTRESILANRGTQVHKVSTPEWGKDGDHVYVRRLGGKRLSEMMKLLSGLEKGGDSFDELPLIATMCVLVVCDKDGVDLFKPADAGKLFDGPLEPLSRCLHAALDFNGLSDAGAKKIRGNSKGGRSPARGTGSPGNAGSRSLKSKRKQTRRS